MSSDFESGEPLYRACSEPSLPTIEAYHAERFVSRDLAVKHAEMVDQKNRGRKEKRPIRSSPAQESSDSKPTTSESHPSGSANRRKRASDRGITTRVQTCEKSTTTPISSSPKSHRTRKRLSGPTSRQTQSDSPSSGSASPPPPENDRDIRCISLRRTESRLDLKTPNKFPRSILKLPSRDALARDSSVSPIRKQGRLSQERYVKSSAGKYVRDTNINRSPPPSPTSNRETRENGNNMKFGRSPAAGSYAKSDRRSADLLSLPTQHTPAQGKETAWMFTLHRHPQECIVCVRCRKSHHGEPQSVGKQHAAVTRPQPFQKIRHLERSPNVRFYVRFHPTDDPAKDWRHLLIENDQTTLFVRALQDMTRLHPMWTYWQFNTDGLLRDVSQDVVFRSVLARKLNYACEGVDIVVMAFGEPGSGKTYTLTGLNNSYGDRGLIPRTLDEVVGRRKPKGYELKTSISYVEFSENRCYDLLAPGKKPVEVNPDKIEPIEVPSSYEALDLLFRGEVKRKFEKVNLNCGSSVYTIHVRSQALNSADPCISFSKIHFVDVPGIETLWNSEKSKPCAISANLDKLSVDVTSRWAYYLSKAIARPSKRKNMAVYGTSGLVSYLERSFTHGYVTLLGTVKPEGDNLRKTLSTLRFGCKVARLHTGLLERHQQSSAAQKTALMKSEIDDLKSQIETSKLLALGEYDRFNVCQGEAQHIERLIKLYIKTNFPVSVTETCLLSTAKPDLLLEEIRRQFQAETGFITSHFNKKSVLMYGRVDSSTVLSEKKGSAHKKRRARGSRDNPSQTFEASQFKEIAEQSAKQSVREEEKDKSSTNTAKAGGPRKSKSPGSRKSVSSRKSMGPRKSKAGGGGKTPKAAKQKSKKGQELAKPEPVLVPIDQAFLERGRKDRVWLMNEFLLRTKDVAGEKETNDSFFEMAREAKMSKAKDLDEYRASLGRTRVWLSHLQSKRNRMDLGPLEEPAAPTEEEKSYLDKERETRENIVKAVDELATLHSMFLDAQQMQKTFQEKLQARFKAWIDEIYVDEKYEVDEAYMKASLLDTEIPRQTLMPSQQLETKSEVDFLKLQEAFFHKKLPIMPIIYE